jgi:hypothetical protein
VFGRHFNLYWMDRANYEKALINEDDSTIVDHALTTDGIENYSYHGNGAQGGGGETNVDKEKNKDKRKPAQIFWSPDSKHFAISRSDMRKVKDLWVINSIADPRPTLETYKYDDARGKRGAGRRTAGIRYDLPIPTRSSAPANSKTRTWPSGCPHPRRPPR